MLSVLQENLDLLDKVGETQVKVLPISPKLEQVLSEHSYTEPLKQVARSVIKEIYKRKLDMECLLSVYNVNELNGVEIRLLKVSKEDRKGIFINIETADSSVLVTVSNIHKPESTELIGLEQVEKQLGELLNL